MPVLEIVDESGQLVHFAPSIIVATMLSPNDERRRHELEAVAYTDTALKAGEPSIPSKIAAVTHRGPGAETLFKETQLQGYDGFLAGQILLFVLRCAVHRPQDASVRKAIHIVEKELARQERLQSHKFPSSTARLRDAWGKFRNVSHLWAAFHTLEREKGIYELTNDNVLDFLATAEALRRIAEGHYPPPETRQGRTTLSFKRIMAGTREIGAAAF